jgi:hypothetical protein
MSYILLLFPLFLFTTSPSFADEVSDPLLDCQVFIGEERRSGDDPANTTYVTAERPPGGIISIDFNEIKGVDVVKTLSEKTGRKFAAHTSLNDLVVTLSLQNVKWTSVLEELNATYGVILETLPGHIIKVSLPPLPGPSLAKEAFLISLKIFSGLFVISALVLGGRLVMTSRGLFSQKIE